MPKLNRVTFELPLRDGKHGISQLHAKSLIRVSLQTGDSGSDKAQRALEILSGETRFLLEHTNKICIQDFSGHLSCLLLKDYFRYCDERPSCRNVRIDFFSGEKKDPVYSATFTQKNLPAPVTEQTDFGNVEILSENENSGLYRLVISGNQSIPCHIHKVMNESELILTSGLLLQGKPVSRGECRRWPCDFPHTYSNPTETPQVILCLNTPPFTGEDEIRIPESKLPPLTDLPEERRFRYF